MKTSQTSTQSIMKARNSKMPEKRRGEVLRRSFSVYHIFPLDIRIFSKTTAWNFVHRSFLSFSLFYIYFRLCFFFLRSVSGSQEKNIINFHPWTLLVVNHLKRGMVNINAPTISTVMSFSASSQTLYRPLSRQEST